ncbi:MAG: methyltransferase C-terminal domain-containing protein, partial [Bradyrhizobium sp.]
FHVERTSTKGGSIRAFAQPKSTGKRPRSERYLKLVAEEQRRGITNLRIYRDWFEAIERRKRAVLAHLVRAHSEGKVIAAYGASTTTTTLLYHFELENRIAFIVDDNPLKQGRFSPGAHIPVLAPDELVKRRPDIVVILAWIYAERVQERNVEYIRHGGTFLIPLPAPRTVDALGGSTLD